MSKRALQQLHGKLEDTRIVNYSSTGEFGFLTYITGIACSGTHQAYDNIVTDLNHPNNYTVCSNEITDHSVNTHLEKETKKM